jgi:hypothetical protein
MRTLYVWVQAYRREERWERRARIGDGGWLERSEGMSEHDDVEGYGPGLALGDPAPDATLPDEDGNEVALSSYWRSQPTVLVFIRHFG